VYRALVRRGLVQPQQRRRRRQDYERWERSRAMELWQLGIVGRIRLADGTQLSAVTGIDDHSRFCVLARLLPRATARPVGDALRAALARHGVPQAILTDNGKVFTARFGPGPGPVLFDRVCHDNGIRHLLTAPSSPTTTGKVERLHKTMRRGFFDRQLFGTIEQAQAALDAWVAHYDTARPHQGIGDRPPADRFALAPQAPVEVAEPAGTSAPEPARPAGPAGDHPAGRWQRPDQPGRGAVPRRPVAGRGAGPGRPARRAGRDLASWGAGRHPRQPPPPRHQPAIRRAPAARPPRPATTGVTVTRIADPGGTASFAGAGYDAGWAYRGQQVQVSLVGDTVQLAVAGRVIKVHPVRHDRAKEHGAFATPTGGHDAAALPSPSTRSHPSPGYRSQPVTRVPGLDSPTRHRQPPRESGPDGPATPGRLPGTDAHSGPR
jgi:transposase InsO family protein